jgi:hypothetical protein
MLNCGSRIDDKLSLSLMRLAGPVVPPCEPPRITWRDGVRIRLRAVTVKSIPVRIRVLVEGDTARRRPARSAALACAPAHTSHARDRQKSPQAERGLLARTAPREGAIRRSLGEGRRLRRMTAGELPHGANCRASLSGSPANGFPHDSPCRYRQSPAVPAARSMGERYSSWLWRRAAASTCTAKPPAVGGGAQRQRRSRQPQTPARDCTKHRHGVRIPV